MMGLNTSVMADRFSIEFLEPGRRHSTLLDYSTLDEARTGAEGLLGSQIASQVVGIIQWDRSLRQPDLEWTILPDGAMAPLKFLTRSIH